MSYLKLKHVFVVLMVLAGLSAFLVPTRYLQGSVPEVGVLFAPVSWPSGAIAAWAHDKIAPELSPDQRAGETVKRENQILKNEVSGLRERLLAFQKLEEYRRLIGDIRPFCTPYRVIGADSGARASLIIRGSSLQGLRDGMFVLYPAGIAGQVRRAGPAGVRVQLITDPGFLVRVGFARFQNGKYTLLNAPQAVVQGAGKGMMQILGRTVEEIKAAGLKPGDYVILTEPDWPPYLQGWHLGRITAIGVRSDHPLFAQITVEPPQNLLLLNEVMIVTRAPGGEGN
ncbi:MAG TPA: rod shape-determining protein MreC [Tepidisphaeraceae bacterium]|jgi:cell shape-determining protein MreC|nr:rod shape-determining protein MreC [Tepidisphaeraceae bacterium]